MRKRGDTKVLKPLAYLFVDEKTLATSAIISPFNKSAFPVPFIYGGSFRNYN